jgi:endonuclease/exonuclease/phosphatase family metal-dependent hydrolase
VQPIPRGDLFRVVTLNIWNRQGPWGARLPLIRDGLRALDADAIGLQEVLGFPNLPSQADEIADGLGWHVHYVPAWQMGGGLTLGNAILSPHELLEVATLTLPTPPGIDTRTVAFARVAHPHGPVPLFITHLTFQAHLGHVRCAQVRALADHVGELAPLDGPPPVLAGDFNADPDADEMRFLRGLTALGGHSVYFADAWLACHAEGPGWTYERRNPYSLRSREPSRRIDYVYSRGPGHHLCGEPISVHVALDQPIEGIWPSDHHAVVADIAMAKRPHDQNI